MIQVRQIPENTRGISRHGLSFISLFLLHSNSCQGNRLIIMNYLISSQPEEEVLVFSSSFPRSSVGMHTDVVKAEASKIDVRDWQAPNDD